MDKAGKAYHQGLSHCQRAAGGHTVVRGQTGRVHTVKFCNTADSFAGFHHMDGHF